MSQDNVSDVPISVIMPAYNEERWIAEAIESILEQTFPDFELIIVDDGSEDSTYKIASSYKDPRMKVLRQENMGPAAARNKALTMARGEYIALQDADDRSRPERLEKQYHYLIKNSKYIGVGTVADIIDIDGTFIYEHRHLASVPENWIWNKPPVIHPSVMFRGSVLKEISGYPDIPISQDTLFLYKLSKFGKLANLQESLYEYRINPQAISRKTNQMKQIVDEILQVYMKTGELDTARIDQINKLKKGQTDNNKLYQYHLLLAKKYLWNNYQPAKSRENIYLSITYSSGKELLSPIFLLMFSFLGERIVKRLYHWLKKYI
jgi:glycosyltransferase involved in cell wall biosynthesis